MVDLAGKNVVPLINWIDYYRANPEFSDGSPPLPVEETLTHEQKKAAERFLDAMREIKKEGLSQKDKTALSELNSGKYREGFDRSSEL
uniref:Uncharacterized protein n=1 Tax=uncultured bacterium contig00040 TaxID=1181528 RepID=A0A806K0G6_9BACT|nr:hypothetical protein [uncultured bacterium contig00040]